jgi:hypothetical protein
MPGETPHLRGLIESECQQVAFQQGTLQMSGPVTDLEDTLALDEWQHAEHPVFPPSQGHGGRDQIVRERELVIQQTKKESQECFHTKRSCGHAKHKAVSGYKKRV